MNIRKSATPTAPWLMMPHVAYNSHAQESTRCHLKTEFGQRWTCSQTICEDTSCSCKVLEMHTASRLMWHIWRKQTVSNETNLLRCSSSLVCASYFSRIGDVFCLKGSSTKPTAYTVSYFYLRMTRNFSRLRKRSSNNSSVAASLRPAGGPPGLLLSVGLPPASLACDNSGCSLRNFSA